MHIYTTHITHARAKRSHTWTGLSVQIEQGDTRPANGVHLGKYTTAVESQDGLTLEIWHTHTRKY